MNGLLEALRNEDYSSINSFSRIETFLLAIYIKLNGGLNN